MQRKRIQDREHTKMSKLSTISFSFLAKALLNNASKNIKEKKRKMITNDQYLNELEEERHIEDGFFHIENLRLNHQMKL